MTKQELKQLMDGMTATSSVEKMTEIGTAMSTYIMEHPEDHLEVMGWFSAAQQRMIGQATGTPAAQPEAETRPAGNFEYQFMPHPEEEHLPLIEWVNSILTAEIEKLKASNKKLNGLLLHTDGEPDFFDLQGWSMSGGKHLGELFMHEWEEEDFDAEDFDEKYAGEDFEYDEDLCARHEAKPDIIGAAIVQLHEDGKWADIIAGYPFTIYIEVHDDGAETEFLTIHNEQGAKPSYEELSGTLGNGNQKRKTAEDFYNDMLKG